MFIQNVLTEDVIWHMFFKSILKIEIICEVVVIINVFQALGSGNLQLIIWVNRRSKIHTANDQAFIMVYTIIRMGRL